MRVVGDDKNAEYDITVRESRNVAKLGLRPGVVDCKVSGADGGGATPVPIPNTAVKPTNADGTATAGLLGE